MLVETVLEGRVVDEAVVGRTAQPTLLCRAPAVPDPHRDALGLGVEPPPAPDVERDARTAEVRTALQPHLAELAREPAAVATTTRRVGTAER